MATNLALDDKLVEEALELGEHASKREAVNAALKEYVQRHCQKEVIKYFGKWSILKTTTTKKLGVASTCSRCVPMDVTAILQLCKMMYTEVCDGNESCA